MANLYDRPPPDLNNFPDIVLINIFNFLPFENLLCSIRLVCRKWFELLRGNVNIWQHRYIAGFEQSDSMEVRRPITRMTDASLLEFLQYAPHIKSIDLSKCCDLTAAGLCEAIIHTRNLEQLYLRGENQDVQPSVLEVVTSHCTKLVDIKFSRFGIPTHYLQSADIAKLSRCEELLYFYSRYFPNVDEAAILTILEGCRKLRVLALMHYPVQLNCGRILDTVSRNQIPVHEMGFYPITGLTEIDETTEIPSLKSLSIGKADHCLTDDCLRKLADCCPNLTHLHIYTIIHLDMTGFKYLLNRLTFLDTLKFYFETDFSVHNTSFGNDYFKIIGEKGLQLETLEWCMFGGMSKSGLNYLRPLFARKLRRLKVLGNLLVGEPDDHTLEKLEQDFPDATIYNVPISPADIV